MREAERGTRTVEVGRAHDQGLELTALYLVHQRGGDACTHLALLAARCIGRVLGHGAVRFPIGVNVVKEDELGAVAFAGVDGVAHHLGPLLLPHGGVVLQPGHQVGHFTTLHRLGHGLCIEQVGGDRLVAGVHLARVAPHLTDGVGVLREQPGEFAADGSVGAEDALHGE